MKHVNLALAVAALFEPAQGRSSGSLVANRGFLGARQPLRCLSQTCEPFGRECTSNGGCVTDKCYDGKCGLSDGCREKHRICYDYAPHTCCTGECIPVILRRDCKRLLAGIGQTDIIDRQCQHLGVCAPWPGDPSPSPLSTPWAVPVADLAGKYNARQTLTFAEGAGVRTDLFIARKSGQTYSDVAAGSVHPGSIRDAGVIVFTPDSLVEKTMWSKITEGATTFCVAPILQNGIGGGFYAVGRNCCNDVDGFTCGDATNPAVRTALVLAGETEKFNQVVGIIDASHGASFHGKGQGITTPVPIFVRMMARYLDELAVTPPLYTYVAQLPTTYCVAPIWTHDGPPSGQVNFWAAGTDCCSLKDGFHCDDTDVAGARSGHTLLDTSGEYRKALNMASAKYSIQLPAQPLLVAWTAQVLVTQEGALDAHIAR